MSTSVIVLLLSVSFSTLLTITNAYMLKEVLAWKTLDWKFKTKADRESAIENERFIPGNAIPTQIEYIYDRRIAITTPRFKEGIPATLSTVHESQIGCGNDGPQSPLLRPYPSWRWNNGDMACDGLTSVTAAKVDVCNRLWVLDSGVVDMMNPYRTTVCSTKIVAFDITSDDAIQEITFGDYILKSNSILVNLAVDVISCEQVYLYSADSQEFGLIVTDASSGDSWRIEHKLFYPYPNWGTLIAGPHHLDFMTGLTSLAVSPPAHSADRERKLYFHSLASARENFVATRVLQNETLANSMPQEFYFSNGEATSQSPFAAFDSRGILFFGLISSGALACWNPATEHVPENIITVAQTPEPLQFVSCISPDYTDNVWVLDTPFIKYMQDDMTPDKVNFRIFVANTRDLTQGTKCENAFQQPAAGVQQSPYYGAAQYPPPPQYPPPAPYYQMANPYPAPYPQLGG